MGCKLYILFVEYVAEKSVFFNASFRRTVKLHREAGQFEGGGKMWKKQWQILP